MRKINNINEKVMTTEIKAMAAVTNAKNKVKEVLKDKKGEGYVDTGIKIIISVVIGGVILAGLYALFNTSVIPTMKSKVTEMFNYAG
jgi:hypothetical protein